MAAYWLGVTKRSDIALECVNEAWWCVPENTRKGDSLLFYCPQAFSRTAHGIFAVYRIAESPTWESEQNSLCRGYGHNKLLHVPIKFSFKLTRRVTLSMLREDGSFALSDPVRFNFQGTTFSMTEVSFKKMIELGGGPAK